MIQIPKAAVVLTSAEKAQQEVKQRKPKLLTHPAFCSRPNPPNTELRRYLHHHNYHITHVMVRRYAFPCPIRGKNELTKEK